MREIPQPAPHRIEPAANRPLVVGVVPGQSSLVALTAATWAQATGGSLYFGYADPTRIVDQEFADGTVRHSPLEPDREDDDWRQRFDDLRKQLTESLAGRPVTWELRYLAGRADRALTHLARAVGPRRSSSAPGRPAANASTTSSPSRSACIWPGTSTGPSWWCR